MKTFFEDYKELCKHSGQFYKKHWRGALAITLISGVLSATPFIIQMVKEKKELDELTNNSIKIVNSSSEEES